MFHIGLILSHFGAIFDSCWAILGHFGPFWAILGYVLAFISDLGISVSWGFGGVADVFDAMFNYVCEVFFGVTVAFGLYFWWCMGGLLLLGILVVAWHVVSSLNMGPYFNCVSN